MKSRFGSVSYQAGSLWTVCWNKHTRLQVVQTAYKIVVRLGGLIHRHAHISERSALHGIAVLVRVFHRGLLVQRLRILLPITHTHSAPYTRIHRLLAKRIAESSDPMRHAHTTHTYITLLSSHASLKSFVTLYICNSGDANTHTRSRFIDSAAPLIARTLVAIAFDIYYQHSQYPIQKTSNTSVASLEQPLPHDKTSP